MNDKEIREAIAEKLSESLGGILSCNRVWSAWSYGTMTEDDFSNIVEDEDFMCELENDLVDIYTMAMEKVGRKAEKWDKLVKLIGCTDGGRYFNDMISAIENFNGKWKRGKS